MDQKRFCIILAIRKNQIVLITAKYVYIDIYDFVCIVCKIQYAT